MLTPPDVIMDVDQDSAAYLYQDLGAIHKMEMNTLQNKNMQVKQNLYLDRVLSYADRDAILRNQNKNARFLC